MHLPHRKRTQVGARVLRPRVLTEVEAQALRPTQVPPRSTRIPPRPTQVPPRQTRIPPRPRAGCRQARLETASTLQRPSTPHTQGAESASSINVARQAKGWALLGVPAPERNHPSSESARSHTNSRPCGAPFPQHGIRKPIQLGRPAKSFWIAAAPDLRRHTGFVQCRCCGGPTGQSLLVRKEAWTWGLR